MAKAKRAGDLSVAELERLLDQRKSRLDDLTKRREKLAEDLERVESEISQLAGDGTPRRGRPPKRRGRKPGGRRPKNAKSLHDTVVDVLGRSKNGLSLSDLTDKVLATGYKTNSKNFKNVLYQCVYNADDISHDSATGNYVVGG